MQEVIQASAQLCAHKGTREVSVWEVDATATPHSTRTHITVPHMDVLYAIDEVVHKNGWSFADDTESRYRTAISKDGSKMFGVTKINVPGIINAEAQLAIGFRNSHDKTMALRLAVGASVFVCDNLVITGDVQSRRIHTWGISTIEVVEYAFDQIPRAGAALFNWWDKLKEIPITADRGVSLLAKAVEAKALPIQDFMPARTAFLDAQQCNNPAILHGNSVWAAYQAVTAQYKNHLINKTQDYSVQLNALMRYEFRVN